MANIIDETENLLVLVVVSLLAYLGYRGYKALSTGEGLSKAANDVGDKLASAANEPFDPNSDSARFLYIDGNKVNPGQFGAQLADDTKDYLNQETDPTTLAFEFGILPNEDETTEQMQTLYSVIPTKLKSDPGGWLQQTGIF